MFKHVRKAIKKGGMYGEDGEESDDSNSSSEETNSNATASSREEEDMEGESDSDVEGSNLEETEEEEDSDNNESSTAMPTPQEALENSIISKSEKEFQCVICPFKELKVDEAVKSHLNSKLHVRRKKKFAAYLENNEDDEIDVLSISEKISQQKTVNFDEKEEQKTKRKKDDLPKKSRILKKMKKMGNGNDDMEVVEEKEKKETNGKKQKENKNLKSDLLETNEQQKQDNRGSIKNNGVRFTQEAIKRKQDREKKEALELEFERRMMRKVKRKMKMATDNVRKIGKDKKSKLIMGTKKMKKGKN